MVQRIFFGKRIRQPKEKKQDHRFSRPRAGKKKLIIIKRDTRRDHCSPGGVISRGEKRATTKSFSQVPAKKGGVRFL